jgi:hypothetical protein
LVGLSRRSMRSFFDRHYGRSWPGRDSAGIKLLAEFRTLSRVRERLGYSNWMTTSTGWLWPQAARGKRRPRG